MLKNMLNLSGAQKLSKAEQLQVKGGGVYDPCSFSGDPSTDWCCALPQGCP